MSLLLRVRGAAGGGITATLTQTEADDTLASSASVAIQATLAVTEGSDTLSSTASLDIQAALAVTEGDDTLVATATTIAQPIASGGAIYAIRRRDEILADDEVVIKLVIAAFKKMAA